MARNRFSLDLRRFIEKAQGNADQVVRKVALDLFKGVVLKTPVDTGRARGSWGIGLGSPQPGPHDRADSSGAHAIAAAAGTVSQAQAGGVIYLSSNLSYITRLERGSSKQAPQGMVRLTVSEYQFYVDQAVRDLR